MIKPLKNRILLSPLPIQPLSRGGIHLVERYLDDRTQWRVEAVGSKVTRVQVGDHVYAPLTISYATLEDGRVLANENEIELIFAGPSIDP